jgi:preprotein translocase subunit SecE
MSEVKKAADQTKKSVKKAEQGRLGKIIDWFKTLPTRISKPFKNMYYELKKVTWPTWKQTMNNTLIVLAFCVVIGLCIFVFDKLAGGILSALVKLFHR